MSEEKKLELLAEAFDMEVKDLTAEKELAEIEEYDSMARLSLIAMMDDEFSKKLTREEIKSFVTVGDILECME